MPDQSPSSNVAGRQNRFAPGLNTIEYSALVVTVFIWTIDGTAFHPMNFDRSTDRFPLSEVPGNDDPPFASCMCCLESIKAGAGCFEFVVLGLKLGIMVNLKKSSAHLTAHFLT